MPSSRPKRQRVWVMAKTLGPQEKAAIGATCDRFISAVLKSTAAGMGTRTE